MIMERYYLIDYENAGQKGLKSCEKLTSSDYIFILYGEL